MSKRCISPKRRRVMHDVAWLYKRGMSVKAISLLTQVSRTSVYNLLKSKQVAVRHGRLTTPEKTMAAKLYRSGLSLESVGQRMRRSEQAVKRAVSARRIPVRRPGRPDKNYVKEITKTLFASAA